MEKIYKINSVTFEYTYMENSGKKFGYSIEDLYYIRDFWLGKGHESYLSKSK